MKCQCGGSTAVAETRASVEGGESFARRRRECLKCGARFSTIEVVIEGTLATSKQTMKPKEPKKQKIKFDAEQVRRNAQARRRLEEAQDEEHDGEIDAILRGRGLGNCMKRDASPTELSTFARWVLKG